MKPQGKSPLFELKKNNNILMFWKMEAELILVALWF
jgi:hypothetical protein